MFKRGARKRWVERQTEYVEALFRVEMLMLKRRRTRYPARAPGENMFEYLRAMIDAEENAVADLDAAKAELRKVRRRLEKQFNDAKAAEKGH